MINNLEQSKELQIKLHSQVFKQFSEIVFVEQSHQSGNAGKVYIGEEQGIKQNKAKNPKKPTWGYF